jgi:hypothetical protein
LVWVFFSLADFIVSNLFFLAGTVSCLFLWWH